MTSKCHLKGLYEHAEPFKWHLEVKKDARSFLNLLNKKLLKENMAQLREETWDEVETKLEYNRNLYRPDLVHLVAQLGSERDPKCDA